MVFACPQFMRINPPTRAPTPVMTKSPTRAPTPGQFEELDGGHIVRITSTVSQRLKQKSRKSLKKISHLGKLLIGLVTGGARTKNLAILEHEVDEKEAAALAREQAAPTLSPTVAPTPPTSTSPVQHIKKCGGKLIWAAECPH